MPTPVSALIHAATMVKSCRWLMWVNQLWYRYILEQPYIKFTHILSLLNKMANKILCSRVDSILFALEGVYQQETILKTNRIAGDFCIGYATARVGWTAFQYRIFW